MEAPPFAGRYVAEPIPLGRYFKAGFSLFAGVLLPLFTIGFELVTRMCAESLFDPVPSLAHLAAVTAVPVINLKLWLMRRREETVSRGWIFAGAAAAAVGFCYALLFLPIYPVAVIGIIFMGLGLLPFAPIAAGLSALVHTIGAGRRGDRPFQALVWWGIATGTVTVLALDIPTATTRYAVRASMSMDAAQRARAVSVMRHVGNRDLLLRLCYDNSGYTGGLLGLIVEGSFSLRLNDFDDRRMQSRPEAARELWYRVTGDSYDSVAPPWRGGSWGFARDFNWDPDQGGAQVGGRVAGLSLANSRIDASMDADDAVAYLEWTTEFANTEKWQQREARMTLALPPGAVVTRATLWIDGEEHEAAFASRGAVRAAYERVVTARRDPLLVTTNGADQVLVQMFPVPANGHARFRVGITAPLALTADDRASLSLPAIIDRNFSIDGSLKHAVWIEGDGHEAGSDAGFTTVATGGAIVRERANFTDVELTARRPRVALSRDPSADSVASGAVVQTIRRETPAAAGPMIVLLDGSARAAPARAGLLAALNRILTGVRVGFGIAADPSVSLPPAPWNDTRRAELVALLDSQPFEGGQDNLGALADALGALEGETRATVMWLYGPQGFEFTEHVAALEQVLDRNAHLPDLWLLPVAAGPNKLLRHPRLFANARTLAWSADAGADIGAAFDDFFGTEPRWTITRSTGSTAGLVTGSQHIEKLWALDQIGALLAQPRPDRERAIAIAAQYRLVTPVSGAVVLESNDNYTAAGLTPPDPNLVPTIPEPQTWALIIVACLCFAWALRMRRRAA